MRALLVVAFVVAVAVGGTAFAVAQDAATPATNAAGTPCPELLIDGSPEPFGSPAAATDVTTPEAAGIGTPDLVASPPVEEPLPDLLHECATPLSGTPDGDASPSP